VKLRKENTSLLAKNKQLDQRVRQLEDYHIEDRDQIESLQKQNSVVTGRLFAGQMLS
jgi:hypothetical protein